MKPNLPRLLRWLVLLSRMGFPVAEGLRNTVSPALAEQLARGDKLSDVATGVERPLVAAAEQSDRPLELLERLATSLQAADRLRQQVRRTLLYPRLLMLAVAVETMLLVGVLLPQEMRAMHFGGSSYLLPLAIGLALLLLYPLWNPDSLWGVARRLGVGPGKLGWAAEQALWSRALGHLLQAGRSLPESLALAARVIHSPTQQRRALGLSESVSRGGSLREAVAEVGLDPLIEWAIEAGEAHQHLATSLLDAADALETDITLRASLQLRLLEPVALCLLAGPVLLVVLSFWIPFYNYTLPPLGQPNG